MAAWIAWILGAYLAGSIPFGWLIGRMRGVDVRTHGSGNIGATNVGRVLGRGWGRLCLALDIVKGILPPLGAGLATGVLAQGLKGAVTERDAALWMVVAGAAVAGHVFPVWLRFRGGKGVATGLGATLGVFPVLTIGAAGALVVWIIALRIWRYVGVSSCMAAVSLPVFVAAQLPFGATFSHVGVTIVLAGLVIFRHRGNIKRTLAGTEPKVGRHGTESEDDGTAHNEPDDTAR